MQNPLGGCPTTVRSHLLDRQQLLTRMASYLATPRIPSQRFAFLHFNVAGFRQINGLYGHGAADALQQELARRLLASGGREEWLAHLGADEFALFVPDVGRLTRVAGLARHLQQQLQMPMQVAGSPITPVVLVGIVVGGAQPLSLADLLRAADYALSCAKSRKAGRQLFGRRQARGAARSLVIRRELAQAITDGSLVAHYQPVLDGRSGQVVAVEALARWQHPTLGAVSPAEFIPVAEESELIERLGETMLRQSLAMLARLKQPQLKLHVNLATRQLYGQALPSLLARLLTLHQLDPRQLVLEITESQLMQAPEQALAQMQRLCQLGVGLALDDFGTGYSALHCLISFPLTILKLDRSLIQAVPDSPRACTLLRHIRQLAADLNLIAVAEGVETARQQHWLLAQNIPLIQGFVFSPAVDECKLVAMLGNGMPNPQ